MTKMYNNNKGILRPRVIFYLTNIGFKKFNQNAPNFNVL